jgi:hypothetical protein
MNKVNVFPLTRNHIDTLRNYDSNRRSVGDYLLFFVLPLIAGAILVWLGFGFRGDAVNGFLTTFSILVGLLLNLLVLVLTVALAQAPFTADAKMRKTLLQEIFVNICFAVLVSVVVVVTALVALSYMRSEPGATTGKIATFILTSCTANFMLTMLMIIKRMYLAMRKELDKGGAAKAA